MSEDTVSLVAVGDIMLGDHPICVGHGVGSSLKNNEGYLFSNVSEILKKRDITCGNLECVLSDIDIDHNSLASVSLRGREKSIHELTSAGFNVVFIANNHILEHGEPSLKETKELLQQNGILDVGVADTKEESRTVSVMEVQGVKVGFLAYCLIGDKTAYCSVDNPTEIIEDVKKASSEVDVLIVSMHWGNEFIRKPSPKQVDLGHAIIDAGAKLILGHHPHVLQGVEEYNDGIIAYSMGNFVFDMWQRKMRESMIFSCNISKEGIDDYEILPAIIDKKFRPLLLDGTEKEELKSKITGEFLDIMEEATYIIEVQKRRREYRIDLVKHLIFHFYQYNPRFLHQIISGSIKKRTC
ncbi:CapA family protein [Methanohalophilus sp. RSK]|uniref:CapA family protein n=1 Tax=Methanohalophilus sp. RSK TaxID=2485783 RepID=UPI0013140988|nr:CapA family protein [Methanohalophilus sp. RSK]